MSERLTCKLDEYNACKSQLKKQGNKIESFRFRANHAKQYGHETGRFQQASSWLKGDMVYTVGFRRLDLIRLRARNPNTGKREYFNRRFSRDRMRDVYKCVLVALNLRHVAEHV